MVAQLALAIGVDLRSSLRIVDASGDSTLRISILRSSAYVLLVVAVGIGVGLLVQYRDDALATQREPLLLLPVSDPALSNAESVGGKNAESIGVEILGAGLAARDTPEQPVSRPSTQAFAMTKRGILDQSPTTSVSAIDETEDPNSVIGRPFPISESVSSSCSNVGKQSSCMEVIELLAQMAQEPRDLRWAAETEARLRNWLSQFDDTTIRAVECRTSLCAAETASRNGPNPGFQYGDAPHGKLFNWIPLFGYEMDPSSARVTVTLRMFKRR